MPRPNMFIKSRENVERVDKQIAMRCEVYKAKLTSRLEEMFSLINPTNSSYFDTRDLQNLSYAISFSNPELTKEQFSKKLDEMFEAFTPELDHNDLEALTQNIRESAQRDRETRIAKLDEVVIELREHEKEFGKDEKYYELESVSSVDKINQRYDQIIRLVNSPNIGIYELYCIIREYNLKDTDIDRFKEACGRNVLVKAKKYLDFLDNFQEFMAVNYKKINPESFKDTYMCTVFAMLCQTFNVKKIEFKDYFDSKVKSLEDQIKLENIHILADPIQYEITKDLKTFNFDGTKYSKLSLGNEHLVKCEQDFPETIAKNTDKYLLQTTLIKGEIKLNMTEDSYELVKYTQKYIDSCTKPNEIANPLNKKQMEAYEYRLQNALAEQLTNCTLPETTDSLMTSFLRIEDYSKFFIDGVRVTDIEPIKSYSKLKEPEFKLRQAFMMSTAKVLEAIMEGNHNISYVRLTEFDNRLSYEIIPLKPQHNKSGYVASQPNLWKKIGAWFTNLDKKYDALSVKDQNVIDGYNRQIRNTMSQIEDDYYLRKHLPNPKRVEFENNLINDLNRTNSLDQSMSEDLINTNSNPKLDNVISTDSKQLERTK